MVSVIDVLKYALKYFYPKKKITLDNVVYKSRRDYYKEWFNSQYLNGYWFINESSIPSVLGTIHRDYGHNMYMVDNGARLYLGVKMINFKKGQKGHCKIFYSGDNVFNASFTFNDGYGVMALSKNITPTNVESFVFDTDEVLEDRILYSGVFKDVSKSHIVEMSMDDFNILRSG